MSSRNVIRVFEFEGLYYDDSKPFKQKHWESLCRYLENINSRNDKRIEYYRILKGGIQFTNFVGVIQTGNLTIEVLPKIDRGSSNATNDTIDHLDQKAAAKRGLWQEVLLDMLKECRLLRVNQVDYANLSLRSHSILDIYLELFLFETEELLHQGLLKKYRKEEGNQTALKGQLQFSKQIATNITHQERFYVRYTEYNRDNIYNQLLKKTLDLIPLLSTNSYLLDQVGRLQLDFPELSSCSINSETFDKLRFDRKNGRYKEALLISKMILLNFRPDITGGSENVIAILFDMNQLWEEFVYRRLKKEEANYRISVSRQESKDFWKSDQLSRTKRIRPDIVIEIDKKETIVIDTKWKIIDNLIPTDNDLKQMFVYNLFWGCDRSVLLYPSNDSQESLGAYFPYNETQLKNECLIATIQILSEDKKVRKDLGKAILINCLGKAGLDNLH